MTDPVVPGLHDLVQSQAALIEDLRTRMADLETRLAANSGTRTAALTSEPNPPETSRRGFLRLAGVAAAGAAAVVVSNASPAAATDNSAILQGVTNTGTLPTIVANSTNSPPSVASDVAAIRGNGGTNSVGVWGAANGELGAGIVGSSASGYGVYGDGGLGYSVFAGGSRARYGMGSHIDGSAPPTSGGYLLGDILRNSNGDLYVCIVAGNGTAQFRKLAGPNTAGSLHLASPSSRIYWTANGDGAFSNGTDRLLSAAGAVPVGATALLVSLLAYGTTSDGYLTAYKGGTTSPGTINAYWGNVAGSQISSTTIVPLSASREYRLRLSASGAGQAQVAVDLLGYYA